MVIVLGLAAGLVLGAPVPALAALGLAVWQPVLALCGVAAWGALSLQHKRPGANSAEAVYLYAVAGELRAGSSLRHALAAAAGRASDLRLEPAIRMAAAGQPLDRVAALFEPALPRLGALTASAVRTSGITGGRTADVFDALALLAKEEMELTRERRAATAQARLSAWIVAGIPVVYVVYAAVSGKLAALQGVGSVGNVVLAVGLLLLATGVGAMWGMLREAER